MLCLAAQGSAQHVRPGVALVPRPLVTAAGAAVPVKLEHADVTVESAGSLARTIIVLTLRNPNNRRLEGSLDFPLRPGQQVTAFALDIDGVLRDAVPVPKERGRQVFESIERRNVDPALLEQTAGNHFRLRVYPLPPQGTRQVRLVIDETMIRKGNDWQLALPVQLLSESPAFSLHVAGRRPPEITGAFSPIRLQRDDSGHVAEVKRSAIDPAHGLALRFPAAVAPQAYAGVRGDAHYAMAEVPVEMASKPRMIPRDVVLLWDASASGRKRDHDGEMRLLDRYFKAMGNGRVHLRLLRNVGEDGGDFVVRDGDWSTLRAALSKVVYDGSTDLADWKPVAGAGEYLLVSDGLQNDGDHAMPMLANGQRLYALASSGPVADATRLAAMAEARGGRLVSWQDAGGLDAAARTLLQDGTHVVAVQGDGVDAPVALSRWIDDGMLRVAGRLRAPKGAIRVTLDGGHGKRDIVVAVSSTDESRAQVPQAWAAWTVATLAAEPERNRAAIARLGNDFSLVTAGTSLLVLDDPADYVRYDIPAPPALRAEVARIRDGQAGKRATARSARLDRVVEEFAERAAWWQRDFPKGNPPPPKTVAKASAGNSLGTVAVEGVRDESARMRMVAEAPAAAMAAPAAPPPPPPAPQPAIDKSIVAAGGSAAIRLQPWESDAPYARRLRDAPAGQLYALYLDERDSHASSTAFYLDVADLLLQRGQHDLAVRVLSNLAELELDNRHVLRVYAYRLMQAGDYPHAIQLFRQVLEMANEEPQSHRDLALALAADGQRQEAVRRLYDVAVGEWDPRFAGVELVALNELNQIVATSPQPLETSFIDPRLLKAMPLDLRAVLSWDSDNSDMDLWVTDPNGEKCFYAHKLTYQGGLLSNDFTGGYGPEEFVLRHAKPGKYKVEAHYFGDRQQIVTGATTLSLKLSTGWGMSRQQDKTVTLRLAGKDDTVLVGEFEVN
ncbi:MAG: DUF2135 domain-containing protein [Proteobacteria bacterium]|nr:DUF2135 domain-containing protein [Pseudomonadota bacterium]